MPSFPDKVMKSIVFMEIYRRAPSALPKYVKVVRIVDVMTATSIRKYLKEFTIGKSMVHVPFVDFDCCIPFRLWK